MKALKTQITAATLPVAAPFAITAHAQATDQSKTYRFDLKVQLDAKQHSP